MTFRAGFPISILVVGRAPPSPHLWGGPGVGDEGKQPPTSGGTSLYQLMSTYQHLL